MSPRGYAFLGLALFAGGMLSYLLGGWLSVVWQRSLTQGPVIEYPKQLDLGDQDNGKDAIGRFAIRNTGNSELVVDRIATSCACGGLEQEVDGRYKRLSELRLAPGKTAHVLVRVRAGGVPVGSGISTTISFRTNDDRQPMGLISAKISRVTGGVVAVPRVVVVGPVAAGANLSRIVDIRDSAKAPRAIERLTSSNPECLSACVLPPEKTEGHSSIDSSGSLIGRIEIRVMGRRLGLK